MHGYSCLNRKSTHCEYDNDPFDVDPLKPQYSLCILSYFRRSLNYVPSQDYRDPLTHHDINILTNGLYFADDNFFIF